MPGGASRNWAEIHYKLAKEARLEKHPYVQAIIKASAIRPNDQSDAKFALMLYQASMHQRLEGTPFDMPTPEQLFSPDQHPCIIIGALHGTDHPIYYPLDALTQHVVCLGAPGTGKTVWLGTIAYQLLKLAEDIRLLNAAAQHRGLPTRPVPAVWILENTKRDFRWLSKVAESAPFDFAVLDDRTYVFNPLQVPEGVRPEIHANDFVHIFAKVNGILTLGVPLLTDAVFELYDEFGVFRGGDNFPTLADIMEKLRGADFWDRITIGMPHVTGNVRWSLDGIAAKLRSYLINNEQLYGASKGFPIDELAQRNFALELSGLGDTQAQFIANSLLNSLYQWRWARHDRGGHLRNLIIVDEAKWLVPPKDTKRDPNNFSAIAELLAKCREVGIGFVLADQTANLDDAVFVNSMLKMSFRLGDGNDIERVKKSIKLDEDQAAYISNLKTAEVVMRWPGVNPVLSQVPKVRTQD